MNKGFEQVTPRKGNLQANKHMKTDSVALVIKEMQNTITTSGAILSKAQRWRRHGEADCCWGSLNWYNHTTSYNMCCIWKRVFLKTKNSIYSIYPRKTLIHVHRSVKNVHTSWIVCKS